MPFLHRNWQRVPNASSQGSTSAPSFQVPRVDLNSPDMYIPVMGLVTYILAWNFQQGMQGSFDPENLYQRLSTTLASVLLDLFILKMGLYLLVSSKSPTTSITELACYVGYKFVPLTLALLLPSKPYLVSLVGKVYLLIAFGVFLLRSVKFNLFVDSGNDVHTVKKSVVKKCNYFLFVYGFVWQSVLMWLMGSSRFRAQLNIIKPSSPDHNQQPIGSRGWDEGQSVSDTDQGLLKPPIRTNSRSVSADYLLYLDNHLQSSDNSLMGSISSNEQIDADANEPLPLKSEQELLEIQEKPIIQSVLYNYWYNEKACHGWAEILTLLVITPVLLILRILIPSPDNLFGHRQNRGKITCIQVFVAPLLIDYFITDSWHLFDVLIIIATALLFYYLRSREMHGFVIRFVSILAFLLSVSTISFIVKNVVEVLRRSAAALNVSEAMLGLTIFAWGNSVGDLATTVTFTKMGVLDVALGACFGGPLLYFLFGIGLDGMLVILLKKGHHEGSIWLRHIDFEVSALLIVSCLTLLAAFAVYLIVIPLNNWRVDKNVGIILLVLYAVATALNIYFELY